MKMLMTVIPAKLNETKDKLILIDQTLLPNEEKFLELDRAEDIWEAIKKLRVRGAPAIGIAAAFGLYVCSRKSQATNVADFKKEFVEIKDYLATSRPTAVNLFWALERMMKRFEREEDKTVAEIKAAFLDESEKILAEDQAMGKAIGAYGLSLLKPEMGLLTHCNAGALATVAYGTALGVVREAHYTGKNIFVYADETRPRLQGGKLTAWELVQEGIPSKLIADNVAATLIRDGKIDVILVGADRIAFNGDTANKIGTFMLSVIAKTYNVPFYIVAPTTTIDFEIETGDEIVIEERSPEEVTHINGIRIAPEGIDVYNPAFDVTPNENITGIITEKGIVRAPYKENIMKLKIK